MSSVSFSAGDVGWTDSLTCDLCGVKVERQGTGVTERTQLSITDSRRLEQHAQNRRLRTIPLPALPEIEFEKREFASDALKGWGSFSSRGGGDDDPRPQMDLCPTCVQVVSDLILGQVKDPESTAPFGTREEKQYGKEVPAVPLQLQPRTEHLYSGVIGGGQVFTVPEGQQIPRLSSHAHGAALDVLGDLRRRLRDAVRGVYGAPPSCVGPDCQRPAMQGEAYCYEHAARGGS